MHVRRQEPPAAALFEQGAQHFQLVGEDSVPRNLQAARHRFVRIRVHDYLRRERELQQRERLFRAGEKRFRRVKIHLYRP